MEKVFSVTEFHEFINLYLAQTGSSTIEGEISQIQVSQGKWLFLTIKDDTSSLQIFSTLYQISNYQTLEEGMLVKVFGTPKLYKTGKFSVFATQILPSGEGAIKLAFKKLKIKLESEGLFDPSRKRNLPLYPEKIGLVTAEKSRAYGDFIKILKERLGGLTVYFFPVSVQGAGAVTSIISSLKQANQKYPFLEALVLARGGGSSEDLVYFNDEKLARAIYSSKIPVISAIGHEDDTTIADLVADARASTPSNAAEILVPTRQEISTFMRSQITQMDSLLRDNLQTQRQRVQNLVQLQVSCYRDKTSVIENLLFNFHSQAGRIHSQNQFLLREISSLKLRLENRLTNLLQNETKNFSLLLNTLKAFDLNKTLKRGFVLVQDTSQRYVKSAKDLTAKDLITSTFFDGKILSEVK